MALQDVVGVAPDGRHDEAVPGLLGREAAHDRTVEEILDLA